MTRHLLQIDDLGAQEILTVLDRAEATGLTRVLAGKGAALIFEHPSARTRNASEMAIIQLGGHPVAIRGEEIGFDRRESVEDIARTLGCYHALIGARVASHATLERMVEALDRAASGVSVINLLSDVEHPTQALADLLTIRQSLGRLAGVAVAFIGDANNVCRSLINACAMVNADVRVASPTGFELADRDLEYARSLGGSVQRFARPQDAAEAADVLYTDVWVSMGEEAEAPAKRAAFAGFCIDEALVAGAREEAIVMHCLPAHRGEEIAASVIDGSRSRVWLQAENRMHSLRGVLSYFFAPNPELADGAHQ